MNQTAMRLRLSPVYRVTVVMPVMNERVPHDRDIPRERKGVNYHAMP
jgi:hypothetical protein